MTLSHDIERVLAEIGSLPAEWHKAGSLSTAVLRRIAFHLDGKRISHSLETGSGKSTLLFSHLSGNHKVFAINMYDGFDTQSITKVTSSALFKANTVEYIEGPTQLTLPRYRFASKFQAALIDGPHGYPFPELEYYYIYPQLDPDALLIVDDIHIPTVRNLFNFLSEEEMFSLLEVAETTAFFRRTTAPVFSPVLDGWWLQNYNKKRFEASVGNESSTDPLHHFRWLSPFVPTFLKKRVRARFTRK